MLKNKAVFVSVIILLVALFACGPKVKFESSISVPDKGWHKDTVAVFKSEISELDDACHLFLEVENSQAYSYSNIWFFVDAIFPSGNIQRDTIECTLANKLGEWYGKSSLGTKNYVSLHPYKLNIKFPEKGLYKYYVVQGMRDTVITGISKVGIKIVEVK